MTIIRRAAGIAAVVFSVAGVILCIACIAGAGLGANRVERIITALFTTADDAFALMEDGLDRVNHALENSQQRVVDLSSRAERVRNSTADLGSEIHPLTQAIDAAYAELQAAGYWLTSLQAIAGGVNRVATAVVESKEIAADEHGEATGETDGVIAQRVAAIAADVAEALSRLEGLRQELIDNREDRALAREVAAEIVTRISELDGRLVKVNAKMDDLEARVSAAKASCADLGRRVQRWTTFVMTMLVLVFLWFAISQVGMMRCGWRFARWTPTG